MLIYRGMRDDGSMLAYKISMRQLDRVEGKLRSVRGWLHRMRLDTRENSDILQVAINRAVSKRIRLSTAWWKVSTRKKGDPCAGERGSDGSCSCYTTQ